MPYTDAQKQRAYCAALARTSRHQSRALVWLVKHAEHTEDDRLARLIDRALDATANARRP